MFVVDAGRLKENRFDNLNKMATLVETWVSKASAKQRRGRAGRVKAGVRRSSMAGGTPFPARLWCDRAWLRHCRFATTCSRPSNTRSLTSALLPGVVIPRVS